MTPGCLIVGVDGFDRRFKRLHGGALHSVIGIVKLF